MEALLIFGIFLNSQTLLKPPIYKILRNFSTLYLEIPILLSTRE